MDRSTIQIRQRFDLGDQGDKAEVLRIVRSDGLVYVEVRQTKDATEPTVMIAVNTALDEYERVNGIDLEDRHGRQKEPAEA